MRALIVVALIALAAARVAGDDVRFKIIVNPDNKIDEVDREFLHDVYLKKATEWGDGKTVRPVDLSARSPVRDRFRDDVLRKTAAQLHSYWNQQIFSGKGVPPPEVETTTAAINYVLANPGGVGYLPADADPGRARVVRLR